MDREEFKCRHMRVSPPISIKDHLEAKEKQAHLTKDYREASRLCTEWNSENSHTGVTRYVFVTECLSWDEHRALHGYGCVISYDGIEFDRFGHLKGSEESPATLYS